MSLCKFHFFFCYCDNKLGLVVIVMLFVLSVWRSGDIFWFLLLCKRSGNNQFNFFICFLLLWCDARCGNLNLTSPWVIFLVFDFFFWFLVGFVFEGVVQLQWGTTNLKTRLSPANYPINLVSLGEFSLHWKCSNYSNIHGSNKFGFVRRICWSALEMFKLLRHTRILHGRMLNQQWVLI